MQISSDKSLSLLSQRAAQNNNSSSVNQTNSAQVQKVQSNTANTSAINDISRQERFDVDEDTLAFIEQEFEARSNSNSNSNNELGGELVRSDSASADQSNQSQRQSNNRFETLNDSNQSAVSTYESINSLANTENIQQLFGVDLFA